MSKFRRHLLGLVVAFFIFGQALALNVEYCSSVNTASTNKNASIYQSNGLCHDFCLANWAFAVLQDDGCWCSNYAPGETTSTSNCNEQCPGYPSDLCGNEASGLFAYIALVRAPLGTQGGSAAATISSTSSNVPTSSQLKSAAFTSSSSTTTSSSSSSTWTPTPIISLETVTGQVRTVTVTPTIPPTSQNIVVSKKSGKGISTGAAVGLTIGLVLVIAILCGTAYFCFRRRRQINAEESNDAGSRRESVTPLGGPVPSRTMSENSRYILGTDGRQVVEAWEPEMLQSDGSRKSRLMPVDPRLNPFAPVYRLGENKSRESINTIRDDHDYSRRVHQQAPILRATNPDD